MAWTTWNERSNGNLAKAIEACLRDGICSTRTIAKQLGLSHSTLWRRMQKLGFRKEQSWRRVRK